jgi:uncharacterized protein (DUF362 family)
MIAVQYNTEIETSVRRLLEATDPFKNLDRSSRIVLKPNIVISRGNWRGANTDPAVVEAVVVVLKENGFNNVTIADGSGIGHSATRAFGLCGYTRLARQYDVNLVDIETDRFVTVKPPVDGPFSRLSVARTITQAEFLVNLPVLKAHCETRITCSLKNLKGVMPQELKSRFHGTDLHRAIAQLAMTVRPNFILLDGTWGDLTSELGGNPVEMGILAAGDDPLETDSFAASALGFEPSEITHLLRYAEYRGVDLSRYTPRIHHLNTPGGPGQFQAEPPSVDHDPFGSYPCRVSAEGVCCTCRGNLIFALERLARRRLLTKHHGFVIGKRGTLPEATALPEEAAPPELTAFSGTTALGRDQKTPVDQYQTTSGRVQRTPSGQSIPLFAVGDCAVSRVKTAFPVPGCPPETRDIIHVVQSVSGSGDTGSTGS